MGVQGRSGWQVWVVLVGGCGLEVGVGWSEGGRVLVR